MSGSIRQRAVILMPNHHLAEDLPAGVVGECRLGLRERKHAVNHGAHGVRIDRAVHGFHVDAASDADAAERRQERQLIEDYVKDLDEICATLAGGNYAAPGGDPLESRRRLVGMTGEMAGAAGHGVEQCRAISRIAARQ